MRFRYCKNEFGKLIAPPLSAVSGGPNKVCRLAIRDKYSNLEFLVDTGAEISVVPPRKSDQNKTSAYKLFAANGSTIKTYGVRHMTLNLGLRRDFKWEFIVSGVTRPILGADFLKHFNLLVDLKQQRLIDNETTLTSVCSLENVAPFQITTLDSTRTDIYAQILKKFPEVLKPHALIKNIKHTVVHHLETKGPPVFARARRLAPDKLQRAKEEFQTMMELGICRPSKSSWASPIHLVSKSDGSLRPCGDYRALNNITIPDKYPLPHIQDFNSLLASKTIFSKIDLVRAFHQIPVNTEDIPKTAVITPFGLFEFLVLPFGLRNAAQTFQRFIHEVLRELNFCFAYLDDILVFSSSEQEHKFHLETIFKRLKDFGMTVNVDKSMFGKDSISFLGYHVSSKGILPLPERVESIVGYKLPETVSELKRFLGIINYYRRSLPKTAETQLLLTDLTKGSRKNDKTKIEWSQEQEAAFVELKNSLANAAMLSHPDPSLPISLYVDASNRSIGAVLQQHKGDNIEPLAFFSKKLSNTEQIYSTYDRELLAAYSAVRHFRHFVEGREFVIFTDHKPLTFAFSKKTDSTMSPRQIRQLSYLAQFSTNIQHISGKSNVVADALSRIETITSPSPIPYSEIAKSQEQDTELQNLITSPKCNLILKKILVAEYDTTLICDISTDRLRPFIPKQYRKLVFDSLHELSHPGIKSSIKLVQDRFVWPNLKSDIRNWAQCCIPCQSSKINRHTKSAIGNFPIPDTRFSHINLDIIGPLPPNNNFSYCVTMIDRFTRWPEAIPVADITAETVAKAVYFGWVSRFGSPSYITTDQGRQFESELFSNLTKFLGAKRNRTTAYHPCSNGKIERWHRSLKAAIKCHMTEKWVEVLPHILLGLRTIIIRDLGTSPSELVYGQTLRLPADLIDPPSDIVETNSFLGQLKGVVSKLKPTPTPIHGRNQDNIFIHPELNSCDYVFIRIDAVKKPLQKPYTGPHKVISRHAKYFMVETANNTAKNVSIDRLKPAFILNENCVEEQNFSHQATGGPIHPQTTRSGRIVKQPVRFNN